MSEERTIEGEIEGWSTEPRKFGKGPKGSRGVKVEGDWHNIIDDIEELKKLDTTFPPGSQIKFLEKKNKKGYWDIDSPLEILEKKIGDPKVIEKAPIVPANHGTITTDRNKDILLQVAFKAATEAMNVAYRGVDTPIDIDDLYKRILAGTDKLYRGIQEVKTKLQENGGW